MAPFMRDGDLPKKGDQTPPSHSGIDVPKQGFAKLLPVAVLILPNAFHLSNQNNSLVPNQLSFESSKETPPGPKLFNSNNVQRS